MKLMTLTFIFLSCCSCITFTAEENAKIKELQEQGKTCTAKSPTKAALFAILPGGGLYVAGGKDRPSKQQEDVIAYVSFANWATWPVSMLWAIPQSYIDAERVNNKELLLQNQDLLNHL